MGSYASLRSCQQKGGAGGRIRASRLVTQILRLVNGQRKSRNDGCLHSAMEGGADHHHVPVLSDEAHLAKQDGPSCSEATRWSRRTG
jgi:hypothetical protein